jgi:hypothetical protein
MTTLFEIALSAHYNALKLIAESDQLHELVSGQSEGRIDLKSWQRNLRKVGVKNVGDGGPLLSRILTPEKAAAALEAHRKTHHEGAFDVEPAPPPGDRPQEEGDPKWAEFDRKWDEWVTFAFHENKYQGPAKDTEYARNYAKVRHRNHRSRHATAMWTAYDWLQRVSQGKSADAEPVDPMGKYLKGTLLGPDLYERLGDEPKDYPQALAAVTKAVHPSPAVTAALGQRKAEDTPTPQAFEFTELTVDKDNVTRVAATIAHDDPLEKIAQVAEQCDPRNWSKNFPELWTGSYQIDRAADCVDRHANPEPRNKSEIGKPWSGDFFEGGQICIGGIPVLTGRVLLAVEYGVAPLTDTNGKVSLKYQLHEALTTGVLCFLSAGGPDVDTYEDFSVTVASPRVTTTAGKHLRYADNVQFSEELNTMALPLWAWAITGGLYHSVSP